MSYRVLVDDGLRGVTTCQRYIHAEYATYAEALAACEEIVDWFLRHEYLPGMPASALYFRYLMFGRDPCIVNRAEPADPLPGFAAWDYAKLRCVAVCAPASETPAA